MSFALLLASLAAAASAEATPPAWHLNAGAEVGSPAVFDFGVGLGAAAELQRSVAGPFFGSARLGYTLTAEANQSFLIDHHQFAFALGAGAAVRLGAARLWAEAGGGPGLVYEVLTRHQYRRIEAAGVPGANQTTHSLCPHAFAELGLAVDLRAGFSANLSAGPWAFFPVVDGARLSRWGGFARLGVGYAF